VHQQIAAEAADCNSQGRAPRTWYSTSNVIPFPKGKRPPESDLTAAINAKVRRDYAALKAACAGRWIIPVTFEHHQRYDFRIVAGIIVGGLQDGCEADDLPQRRRRKLKPYPTYYDLIFAARPIDADGRPLPLSKTARAPTYNDARLAGKVHCRPYQRVDIWRATKDTHERETFRANFPRGRNSQITFAPKAELCPRWYACFHRSGKQKNAAPLTEGQLLSNRAIGLSKSRKQKRRKRTALLEPDHQAELCKRIEAGDVLARNEVIAAYQPMVIRISKEYAAKFDCPVDELVQVANCGTGALGSTPHDGLIYALGKYRQSDGAFPPYAERAIKWALQRYLERRQRSSMATLDKVPVKTSPNDDPTDGDTWKDALPDDLDDIDDFDIDTNRARLTEALDGLGLTARDRLIFESRHGLTGRDAQTLEAIGRDLGVSGERIRQIESRIGVKLAARLDKSFSEQNDNASGGAA
jgi:RNA polymerase sigma factor (sigma-70 family)